MTAVISITRPDAIHIFTDGAFQLGGELKAEGSKVSAFPHACAVYVGRGDGYVTMPIAFGMNVKPTLDRMVDDLAGLLAVAERETFEVNGVAVGDTQHILAGWSDRARAFASYFLTTETLSGVPVRQPIRIGNYISPEPGRPIDPHLPNFDLHKDGPALMREQMQSEHGRGMVGGFCQLTSVYRDKIETRILERWN